MITLNTITLYKNEGFDGTLEYLVSTYEGFILDEVAKDIFFTNKSEQ